MHAGSESKVKILSFTKPEKLLFNGVKTPTAEVERIIGKSLTLSLNISEAEYEKFKRYCQEKLVCHIPPGVKTKLPVPYNHLDIINMGEFGYGIKAVKPIPKDTLVCYYFGEIYPTRSVGTDPKSLYRLNLCNDESRLPDSEKYVIDIPEQFCHASLLQHLPNKELLDGLYDFAAPEVKAQVATANLDWDTVHLFDAGKGKTCAAVAMFACRNIEAGEMCGFSYTSSYWYAKEQEPALFDRAGKPIEPGLYRSRLTSTPPQSHSYDKSLDPENSSIGVFTIQKTLLEQGKELAMVSRTMMGRTLGQNPIDLAVGYVISIASRAGSLPVHITGGAQTVFAGAPSGGAGGRGGASSDRKP